MIAVDTNILVRVVLNDDPQQYPKALSLLQNNDVLVAPTVLLELIWVLRSIAGLSDQELRDAIRALAAWPRLTIVSLSACGEFLRLWEAGLDAADAAHLAFVGDDAERFVTFDKPFVRRATRASARVPIRAG